MEKSPMGKLPEDPLHQIFSSLPLRQILISRSICKSLYHSLTSPSFLSHLSSSSLPLLVLRPPHHHHHHHRRPTTSSSLLAFDPSESRWLTLDFSFLPFFSLHPVSSSSGLVFFWADSLNPNAATKTLIVCNILTRQFKVLPQLGSAWSRHGSVLVDSDKCVIVLTELAALYLPKCPHPDSSWLNFSSNLPSKPRSPVLVSDRVFTLCDVGSPWRSQWKLFACNLSYFDGNIGVSGKDDNNDNGLGSGRVIRWVCLERKEWGEVFDIMKRPRLMRGARGSLLMVGGLKSTFSLNPICSTILMLRLDLGRLEWEEAGRMPLEMYRSFAESSKLKVFGGGDKICFSAKRIGKLALWDENGGREVWRWIDGVPGTGAGGGGDGLFRGFVYEARLDVCP